MKKLSIFLIFCFSIMWNTLGIAANQPLKFIEDKTEPSEFELIETLIQKYEQNLVRAINENRFDWVEPYLLSGSHIYLGQKTLIQQLHRKGIKERFIACEIIDCRMVEPNQYKVFVKVIIGIRNIGKPETVKEFLWIYRVLNIESKFGLSDIEEWGDSQQYIEQQKLSAKADGYYAMELMRYYGPILTDAINTMNITQIKAVSSNKSVLGSHKKLILNLRKIGSEFELSHFEFTPSDRSCSRYEVKMVFSPNNKDSRDVTIKLEIMIREIRKCFSGYAVITGIKEIR